MTEGQRCSGPKRPIMTNSTGILSSTAALRSGYGLPGCEWVLRAQTGQNLRISLVDFSLASRYTSDSWYHVDGDREYCYVYAVIREQDGAKEFTVCASNQRETVQYTSTTSQVEIIILDVDQESAQNFIFKYEGNSYVHPSVLCYIVIHIPMSSFRSWPFHLAISHIFAILFASYWKSTRILIVSCPLYKNKAYSRLFVKYPRLRTPHRHIS